MAHTYKYTILTAVPDVRRGERVNVGVIVFRDERLDVRFRQASSKLRALTGDTWESRIQSIRERIEGVFKKDAPVEDVLRRVEDVDPLIAPVGLGTINAGSAADCERIIEEIIASLVVPPRPARPEGQSRINTEIAKIFQKDKVLASPHASLTEKKIVRDLPVAPQEGLTADFALQNGKLHVASTLDLRKHHTSIAEAALKSIVLDKSGDLWGKKVRKLGVYAVLPDMKREFKQHIELLSDYADETYNWLDQNQHRKFIRRMYDALPTVFARAARR